ncbi:MAG: hypothetical protein PHG20_12965, partial [Geobacteraceae bacterium]|nr:hypothetical protein [Geobacteraceae bacterium]
RLEGVKQGHRWIRRVREISVFPLTKLIMDVPNYPNYLRGLNTDLTNIPESIVTEKIRTFPGLYWWVGKVMGTLRFPFDKTYHGCPGLRKTPSRISPPTFLCFESICQSGEDNF